MPRAAPVVEEAVGSSTELELCLEEVEITGWSSASAPMALVAVPEVCIWSPLVLWFAVLAAHICFPAHFAGEMLAWIEYAGKYAF